MLIMSSPDVLVSYFIKHDKLMCKYKGPGVKPQAQMNYVEKYRINSTTNNKHVAHVISWCYWF